MITICPPLETARVCYNNQLFMNQTATISSGGAIGAKQIMYICAPLASNGEEALHTCYQTILAKAIEKAAKKILIPSLSTGLEGYNASNAASIAYTEITHFLKKHQDVEVHVVTYSNGKKNDERNAREYRQLFQSNNTLNFFWKEGEIQYMPADLIVVPVGMHFTYPGAVSMAVDHAAVIAQLTSSPQNKSLLEAKPPIKILEILPSDILSTIFSFLSIKSLGKVASVCKAFLTIQSCDFIWKTKADKIHLQIDPSKNVKQQIKDRKLKENESKDINIDGKIKMKYGTLNLTNKTLTTNLSREDFYKLHFEKKEKFFEKVISFLPTGHFVKYYLVAGSYKFYYRNEKGEITFNRTSSRFDLDISLGDSILDELKKSQTEIDINYLGEDAEDSAEDTPIAIGDNEKSPTIFSKQNSENEKPSNESSNSNITSTLTTFSDEDKLNSSSLTKDIKKNSKLVLERQKSKKEKKSARPKSTHIPSESISTSNLTTNQVPVPLQNIISIKKNTMKIFKLLWHENTDTGDIPYEERSYRNDVKISKKQALKLIKALGGRYNAFRGKGSHEVAHLHNNMGSDHKKDNSDENEKGEQLVTFTSNEQLKPYQIIQLRMTLLSQGFNPDTVILKNDE